ncbi:hypothetical protein [Qipengyuania marisflavi]|uniref:hypothetical protein n=1 Tax=Qipengyuania marisflavi TaxID=2486356 RepID=UPI001FE9AE5B|nr:hypothetical protein [Qipengyuania marisflavi]
MSDHETPSSPSLTPTRAIARQATSAVAYTAPEPEADDPLLGFAPYLHTAPRRNSITPDLQRRFVATLAATGIVTQAARSIGKSLEALYKLRARPGAEGFAAAWDAALRHGTERLEDCALERALGGGFDDDPVSGWAGRGNGLLIYLLGLRTAFRVDERAIVPGHPLYERIRGEVLAAAGVITR